MTDRATSAPERIEDVVVLSHTQPEQTAAALTEALAAATAAGCRLYAPDEERAKHGEAGAALRAAREPRRRSRTSAWCSAATARS